MAETIYAVGTVSVSNGGTTVTGVGTSWQGKIFAGDLFTDPAQGLFARVTADATSNTSLTINPWPGTALSGDAYEILLTPDSVRASERTRQLLEQLSIVQANGRGLFFRFSDTTADADPGAGYLRLNNADPSLATAAFIDLLDANGATVSGEIDTWDDSTSLNRGNLWLRGIADPSAFRVYSVTGSIVDGTGYRKLTLAHVGGSGSFAADDELMVAFARTGDAGDSFVYDETVADPSDLTALEGEAAGYLVFVTNLGTDFGAYSGRSGVVRLIAGPDWELVAIYTGTKGGKGDKGAQWEGAWVTATAYAVDDIVRFDGSSYICLEAHTSGTFSTDLAADKWELFTEKGGTGSTGPAGGGLKGIACRVASTVNVAIATGLEAGDTVDGVTLSSGDLVLLTGQTAPAENGVYIASVSGAASRHPDFDAWADFPGSLFPVNEGSTKADTLWRCNSNAGGTIGSTALVFAEASAQVLDEDDFASNSAALPPSQQSVAVYVGANRTPDIILTEVQTAGTNGGDMPATTWTDRLNTEEYDRNGDCTFTGPGFVLEAGDYYCEWEAVGFFIQRNITRLYNVTDAALIAAGSSEYAGGSGSVSTKSCRSATFTIGASKTLKLQHNCETTRASNGKGIAANLGVPELYAILKLWKLS